MAYFSCIKANFFGIGSQSVHILTPEGKRLGQIRFDTSITKAHIYKDNQNDRMLLMVAGEDQSLSIYEDTRLIWRAHNPSGPRPSFLSVTNFK